jgi:DNA-binding transcriptional LysR family regulator
VDDLRRFDLNLLVAFDALMAERSVTAAARRLGIGQPAMSNALARLRVLFGDPLLTRTPSGMQPTGRALELATPVARIIGELREEVLSGRAFQPETDARLFRIGVSDQVEVALMPGVLRAVRAAAPGVRLVTRAVEAGRGAELLATGAIDVVLGYLPDAPGDIEAVTLYRESFVCLFDAAACGMEPPLSLDAYAGLPHVLVSLRGEPFGHFDEALRAARRSRAVIYTTQHFLAAPFLLRGIRAVAALPRRLAENCADAAGLATCPVPLPSDGYAVGMAWHQRTAADPAQRWLRGLVAEVGRGLA